MKRLIDTSAGWSGLILRVGLGVVMFPHGMQKLMGWFGGQGLSATYHQFTEVMHFPGAVAVLVILAESAGSVGLIVGCLTRIAAFGTLCNMIGAIALVHWRNGFFMNWFGQQAGEGFEYHLLAIAISAALVFMGAGNWSIDQALASFCLRKDSSLSAVPTGSRDPAGS
jgi:putative oxidoreductase